MYLETETGEKHAVSPFAIGDRKDAATLCEAIGFTLQEGARLAPK